MVKEDVTSDTDSAFHTLVGGPSEVDAAVEALLQRYPSEGYSTYLKKRTVLPDGQVKAVVFRFISCE